MSQQLVILTDTSGSLTWVGQAYSTPELLKSASVWMILRINDATSGAIVAYADGVTSYTKAWSDRTTYSYTVS